MFKDVVLGGDIRRGIVLSEGGCFHSACAVVQTDVKECVSFVRDGHNFSRWLVGHPEITACGPDVYKTSNPDLGFIKIDGQANNITFFHVGTDPDQLQNRIMIAIHEGPIFEEPNSPTTAQTCLLHLVAWRVKGMTDSRWRELCRRHEKEIQILKQIL